MASRDYDEKIYKLFEEGKKLGAPGITSLNVPAATGMHLMLSCKAVDTVYTVLTKSKV